jgi:hypothetical protein
MRLLRALWAQVDYEVSSGDMPVAQGDLTSLSRTSAEVLFVRLAYLVQPRLRRNGHSHDVEMRSGRHAVPVGIRGSGSFLYNLYLLNVFSSGVVMAQLSCILCTVDQDGLIIRHSIK